MALHVVRGFCFCKQAQRERPTQCPERRDRCEIGGAVFIPGADQRHRVAEGKNLRLEGTKISFPIGYQAIGSLLFFSAHRQAWCDLGFPGCIGHPPELSLTKLDDRRRARCCR
jgi:hypothetical protein